MSLEDRVVYGAGLVTLACFVASVLAMALMR
jgi:hypothetical protein